MLKKHILAESAKIGHKVAGSTNSVNRFNRPVERSKHGSSSEITRLMEDLSQNFRFGSNVKTAINALVTNTIIWRFSTLFASKCILGKEF